MSWLLQQAHGINSFGESTIGRLKALKAKRDADAAKRALNEIKKVAATKTNLMPALLTAAEARCTVGEIMNALADVFGRYDGATKW